MAEAARYLLTRLVDVCQRSGSRLVIVYVPSRRGERCAAPFLQAVRDVADGERVVFVDVTKAFERDAPTPEVFVARFFVHPSDHHPSARAHRLMADLVLERLASRRPLAAPTASLLTQYSAPHRLAEAAQ